MTEESLFHEALARSNPYERAEFLAVACVSRPDLREAVEALLAAHEQSGELLPPHATSLTAHDSTDLPQADEQLTRSVSPQPPAVDEDAPARIGRYEVRRRIGRGGMGTVYLAHDPQLDRAVALKVPRLVGAVNVERFLREARAAAAVDHPNLCRVYDADTSDGVPYLAMAYVPGPTLTDVLKREGRLTPDRAIAVAAGVARGMAEAHRHGVVHRDLKPANVLLTPQGEPVVTDFGLAFRDAQADPAAAAPPGSDPRFTQTGVIMGTPAYMPPEQARGAIDRIGPASDVYALGAILFELLTGRPPYQGKTVAELLDRVALDPVPSAAETPGVPVWLAAVCRKAMAKSPADRFPSMEAFAAALTPPPRRPVWRAVALAAGLVLVVAAVVFYVRTDYGDVEVRLSDPAADVTVTVDGQAVVITDGGRVTRLQPGEHGLEVKGADFETQTRDFKVTRGQKTVVEVELRAKAKQPVKPDQPKPPQPDPDREKLARVLARGLKALDDGRTADLGKAADEALKLDPETPTGLSLRAVYHIVQGEVEAARADATAAVKLNPDTWVARLALGMVYGEDEKLDEAIVEETIAVRLVPDEPRPWANRANSYLNKKEYRQAVADATRAIDLGQGGADAFLNRAAAHVCLGEYKEALADYAAAEKVNPNDWRVFDQRSALHARMKERAKEQADWKAATRLNPELTVRDRVQFPDPPKPVERKKLTAEETEALAQALKSFQKAWEKADLPAAAAAADEAVKIDPTSAQARAHSAMRYTQLNKHQQAVAEGLEAVRLDPELAVGRSTLGLARLASGKQAAAIADLTIALRLDPTDALAWVNRGRGYYERGVYLQALTDLNEAIRLKPAVPFGYAGRAMCFAMIGQYEKALADFEKAADLQPTQSLLRMNCAALKAKLGDTAGAAKDRAEAIRLDPRLKDAPDLVIPPPIPPSKLDPALPPGQNGDTSQVPESERLRLAGLLHRGRQLVQKSDFAVVGQVADDALRLDPRSPGALALRATAKAAAGDGLGAAADAEAALQLNPETFQALIVRGHLREGGTKFDEAIADFTAAVRLSPADPTGWANRASCYFRIGEYRQAIADATRAIDLLIDKEGPYLNRAAAYASLGDYEKALADYTAAAKFTNASPAVFIQRSALHEKMGRHDLAEADWATVEKLAKGPVPLKARPGFPDPPKAVERKKLTADEQAAVEKAIHSADEAFAQGKVEKARTFAEEAVRIDPTSAQGQAMLGRVLADLKNFSGAEAAVRRALDLDPETAWAYVVRASVKSSRKDYPGAVADLTVALRIDPKNVFAWNNRSVAFRTLGEVHQALDDIERCIALKPGYAHAYPNRAACLLSFGEYRHALADYRVIAAAQPKNARWRLYTALLCRQLGDSSGEASERAAAAAIDPAMRDAPYPTLPAILPPPKRDPELPLEPKANPPK